MIATVPTRIIEPQPIVYSLLFFGIIIFILCLFSYLILRARRERIIFKDMQKSCSIAHEISAWLRSHTLELYSAPIETLNHPEFVDLFKRDQELYEKISRSDPGYREQVRAPAEFHKYLLEVASEGLDSKTR